MGFAICDVMGKGVAASLLMASVRASLRAHAAGIFDMSTVLSRVNRDLHADSLTGEFATLFYAVLDHRARRLTYSNAGHPPPLLFREGRCRRLTTGGLALGIEPAAHYRWEALEMLPGDCLLLFTDGLSEALNFNDEAFGMERIERAAMAAIQENRSADAICRHVMWEMRRFAGLQTRFDDLTLVVLKAL